MGKYFSWCVWFSPTLPQSFPCWQLCILRLNGVVIGQHYSWWCLITQSNRSRISSSISCFIFKTSELCIVKICFKGSINFFVLYGSKHTLLTKFWEGARVQEFSGAFDMFCYTKHLTGEKCERSWYISHVLGGVRWCFELPYERIQFLSRKPAPNGVTDKHATCLWAHTCISGDSDVIPWLYSAYVFLISASVEQCGLVWVGSSGTS